MKKLLGLTLSVLACASVFGQTNSPATTNAPAKSAAKKTTTTKKPAATKPAAPKAPRVEKPIVLVPGPASITGNNVNVRGRASFLGEVLARLKKGDSVTVIEQVYLTKPKGDEPSQWAKITFPKGANVFVHSKFIETNGVVKPKRLNVRGGAGENYSVVGTLAQGDAVKEVSRKGDWIEIEAPASCYAFVAAEYLKQDLTTPTPEVPPVISVVQPDTSNITTNVTDTTPVNVPPVEPPPQSGTNVVDGAQTPEETEVPPPPRIVSHEGVVRPTVSIQAPTPYEIWDPVTRMTINYLYSPSTNLDLGLWKGRRIIVTGEEGLDARWKTPVITIQRIQVVQ